MFRRVLLLSASAGAGHVRAANALAEAFRSLAAADELHHIDALQYTSRLYSTLYTRGNRFVVRRLPGIARRLYNSLDSPWTMQRFRTAIDRLHARRLVATVKDYHPDLAVCTHFLPAGIVASLRGSETTRPCLVTVVTDFHVHGMWLTPNTDHYFVASECERSRLINAGVHPHRVTAAGIPIGTAFGAPIYTTRLGQKYGLTADSPVVLISAGRLGFDRIRAISDVLVSLKRELQAMLVCGNDSFLQRRLDQYFPSAHSGAVTFRVFGHSSEMHEIMAVSDLIIGRPGGLIAAEALASGLPFFIVGRLPGQEEWNAHYLVAHGAGVRCTSPALLKRELTRALGQADVLEAMRLRASSIARPRAAGDVVQTILGWAE
jgi:processive 1,2-diacylglycerol beta-glucosyltransferase